MTAFEPAMPSLPGESVSDQRALSVGGMPAARRILRAKACPQPRQQQHMDPLVFASYDVDECMWGAFATTDTLKLHQHHQEQHLEQEQFGEDGPCSFEPHVQMVEYDDDDDLSDCPPSTSSPLSEFSSLYHQHMNDYPGANQLDFVTAAAATSTTTAVLGSEVYPSPIVGSGDDGGCASLNEYYYPPSLDHIPANDIPLPLELADQPYLPDAWSPFLFAHDNNTEATIGDINESAAFLRETESFSPPADAASMVVASPSHVELHAPRPMRIENTAAHLAALVEREESNFEVQEREELLIVDNDVVVPRSRIADQLLPATHLVPYAQLYLPQQSHVLQPVLAAHPSMCASEGPRRRIQPILELDTSGRTVQLRQSMRARRHARNMSVPMSADALQYRPVGWKGRQEVVGPHPHLFLPQDQHAYEVWGNSSRSMDWSALGGDLPFLQQPSALVYSQPETYAPAALY